MRVGRRKLYQSYLNRKEGIERGCARSGSSFERTTQVSRFRFASVLDCNCQAPVNMCQFCRWHVQSTDTSCLKKLLKYLKNNPKVAVKKIICERIFFDEISLFLFLFKLSSHASDVIANAMWRVASLSHELSAPHLTSSQVPALSGCVSRARVGGRTDEGGGLGRRWNRQKQCTLRHC